MIHVSVTQCHERPEGCSVPVTACEPETGGGIKTGAQCLL